MDSLTAHNSNHMLQETPEHNRNSYCALGCTNGIYCAELCNLKDFKETYSSSKRRRAVLEFKANRKRCGKAFLSFVTCPDCVGM